MYQCTVFPFGLRNVPQTMSRLIDKVVSPQLKNQILVYLDNLIIPDTFQRGIKVLSLLAKLLRNAGFTLYVEKSKCCIKEV